MNKKSNSPAPEVGSSALVLPDGDRAMTDEEEAAWTEAYCLPRKKSLWGEESMVSPVLVTTIFGDGLKPMWLEPLATRPEYYVIAGSSAWDLDNGWKEIEEDILQTIECEHGRSDDEREEDESADDHATRTDWPALDTSCGYSWGELDDFRQNDHSPSVG